MVYLCYKLSSIRLIGAVENFPGMWIKPLHLAPTFYRILLLLYSFPTHPVHLCFLCRWRGRHFRLQL